MKGAVRAMRAPLLLEAPPRNNRRRRDSPKLAGETSSLPNRRRARLGPAHPHRSSTHLDRVSALAQAPPVRLAQQTGAAAATAAAAAGVGSKARRRRIKRALPASLTPMPARVVVPRLGLVEARGKCEQLDRGQTPAQAKPRRDEVTKARPPAPVGRTWQRRPAAEPRRAGRWNIAASGAGSWSTSAATPERELRAIWVGA
mmetsp:Transcript_32001/g.55067  ORF Transcript_32001/g.55067 Transcript_32001/m.55067 type:complete len:201 (+) Transcript_32001:200-802(+)